jgi:hypothetical protein
MMTPAFGNYVRSLSYAMTKEPQLDPNYGRTTVEDQEPSHLKEVFIQQQQQQPPQQQQQQQQQPY